MSKKNAWNNAFLWITIAVTSVWILTPVLAQSYWLDGAVPTSEEAAKIGDLQAAVGYCVLVSAAVWAMFTWMRHNSLASLKQKTDQDRATVAGPGAL